MTFLKPPLNQIHRAFLAACLAVICICSSQSSFAVEETGEVAILFDQSASMNDFDPKLVSKKWLMELASSFKKPYNVVFAGFDDRLHEHVRLTTSKEEDARLLSEKIESVITGGITTDLETPLRYLTESNDKRPLSMAVIVSDGEPEIWDEKRPFLSKQVRTDKRYEDLNEQYRLLKSEGRDPRQIYDLLHANYQARNIKLIKERLMEIREKFGSKLVFLDVSGKSEYFRAWAKEAGSEYIAISPQRDASPVERLRAALISLKQKTADIVKEPQPEGKETALEIPLEPVPKATPETGTPEARPEPVPVESKGQEDGGRKTEYEERTTEDLTPAQAEQKTGKPVAVEGRWPWLAVILLLLAATAVILCVVILQRKQEKPVELNEKIFTEKKEIKYTHGLEQLREIAEEISKTSAKDITRYIDEEINAAMGDADELRLKLIVEEKEKFKFERRVTLRIPVPPGAMEVRWTNKAGELKNGPAREISMTAVLFEAKDFDGDGIDAIICPRLNLTLRVKRSDIRQREEGRVVALLEEFEDSIEDRMKWVETLTRIETPEK